MSREEILTALSIRSDEQQEAMRRRLRAMENDGQLVLLNVNAMPCLKN